MSEGRGALNLGLPFAASVLDDAGALRGVLDVQQALLPHTGLEIPGFDVVGHCNYCDETGGDYYDYLTDSQTDEDGAAVLIANFNPALREMRWVSAGHDPPMIYHPHTDTFREPAAGSGGLPLGVTPDERYEDAPAQILPPGAVVLVATDGMWETRNAAREMYGKERLMESLRRNARKSAAEIRDGLLEELHRFRGEGPQEDDETFVIVKVLER